MTNTVPEANNSRSSFFDDDDLHIQFEFSAPNKNHFKDLTSVPLIKTTLLRQGSSSPAPTPGLYALQNKTLSSYRNETDQTPEAVLNLAQSRLKYTPPDGTTKNHGFSVTKNGQTYDFYSEESQVIEDWVTILKKVCILTNFHDEYKALKMIGRGSFAKVYLVETKTTGKAFAVKAFTKEGVIASNKSNAKPSMINEIDIMRVLDHDNIIKLYEVYETEKSIYLVLDLIQGKSLQDTVKKSTFKSEYSDIKVFNIIRSILDALAYLASKGLMHRDLKPDNILLERGDKVKIVDFGLATFINVNEYIFKKCGTPGYIAPEVFKYDQKDPATSYDDRCDVFSAGCIFHYLLHGKAFFEGANGSEILKTNRKFVVDSPAFANLKQSLNANDSKVPKDAIDLILKLLEFNHLNRISAAEALSHPYFTPFPSGMSRIGNSNDFVAEPITKYNQNGNFSPKSPRLSAGLSTPDSFLDKLKTDINSASPGLKPKERFAEKGSLYLDMGRPEVNGRIDTLTSGSTNNSMLLNKRENDMSFNGLPSSFASKGSQQLSDLKVKGQNKSFKGPNGSMGGNQSILKAAIFRNMQKNNEISGEDFKDGGLSSQREERSFSDTSSNKRHNSLRIKTKGFAGSPDEPQKSPTEDHSLGGSFDNSPVGNGGGGADNSFGKYPPSPLRRFQHFAQKK